MEISINKFFVKPLVWLTSSINDNRAIVVCKGYDEDYEQFTGLYWSEDKDADFSIYKDFKIWINI